ncbi:MAG: hypothetical protein OSJ61_21535 [Lachnospiraceae bacterium]|nr:hypothetical protein [Lachnospiraceae bacterium]
MEHNNNEELNQLREFYEQYKNAKQQTEKPFTNTSSNARLNAEFGIMLSGRLKGDASVRLKL